MGAKSKAAHETLWCCGSLHTASIAVGVANIITVVMVTSHYIESELQNEFSLEIIAMSAVAVFLMVSSCLMLYGVIHQMSWLLLPWMVLHLAAVIGSIIFCSIRFEHLQSRAIPILGTAIQSYFFLLVFGHYVELRKINLSQDVPTAADLEAGGGLNDQAKNRCLIDLEVIEEKHDPPDSSFEKNDDTFTDLAFRGSSRGGQFNGSQALPTPDEVIPLVEEANQPEDESASSSKLTDQTKEMENNFGGHDEKDHKSTTTVTQPMLNNSGAALAIPRRTASKSVANLEQNGGSLCSSALQPLLPPARSEPKIVTGMAPTVPNSFSPYRSKNAAQNGPKMKIFLPKPADTNSDNDSSSSSDSSEEEEGGSSKEVEPQNLAASESLLSSSPTTES